MKQKKISYTLPVKALSVDPQEQEYMNSLKQEFEKRLQRPKSISMDLGTYSLTNPVQVAASEVAQWLDTQLEWREIKPNKNGDYYFSVLRRDFMKVLRRDKITKHLKNILKGYDYYVNLHGGCVQIKKSSGF